MTGFPRRARAASLAGMLGLSPALAAGAGFGLRGAVSVELRAFLQDAAFVGQHDGNTALALEPELAWEATDARNLLVFTPFFRLDQGDPRRTHGDIRELSWTHSAASWELRAGIRREFWGVAESNHLVDVINQFDLVENLDQEDKLGQPMLNLAVIRGWGTLDFYVLPGFRPRTFPGRQGRLRSEPRVDTGRATYESAAQDTHVDFALRYSNVAGPLDLGITHFWGTAREPALRPGVTSAGASVLVPHYALMHQTGMDAVVTLDNLALKLEALRRETSDEAFVAAVGGFEYTMVGVFDSNLDLGLLAEYHADERGARASTPFNHDLFAGARLALNDVDDTSMLLGLIADVQGGGNFFNFEAGRRFGDRWRADLELRAFWSVPRRALLFALARDDYVQLTLSRYF